MTLMELLTVIVIIGILAGISIPSYRRYLMRANRTDATTMLLRVASAQEKHIVQYGTYVTTTASLPAAHSAGGLGLATTSERGFYNIVLAPTATGYTATATPVATLGQNAGYGLPHAHDQRGGYEGYAPWTSLGWAGQRSPTSCAAPTTSSTRCSTSPTRSLAGLRTSSSVTRRARTTRRRWPRGARRRSLVWRSSVRCCQDCATSRSTASSPDRVRSVTTSSGATS